MKLEMVVNYLFFFQFIKYSQYKVNVFDDDTILYQPISESLTKIAIQWLRSAGKAALQLL